MEKFSFFNTLYDICARLIVCYALKVRQILRRKKIFSGVARRRGDPAGEVAAVSLRKLGHELRNFKKNRFKLKSSEQGLRTARVKVWKVRYE